MIKEEEIDIGKVVWAEYKEFFSFAFGGIYGIVFIFVLHVIINLCTMAVSLFLALTLTHRFTDDNKKCTGDNCGRSKTFSDMTYNVALISIILFALLS